MPQWAIPELHCPFVSAVNDRVHEAEEGTAGWIFRHGLAGERYAAAIAAAAARLAARTRPRAGYEALRATSDFYAWMFVRDDYCDETAAGLNASGLFREDLGSLAVLQRRREGAGSRERALADVLRRLSALSPGRAWRRGFSRQMRAYFQATFWEAANRFRGEVPDLRTYSRMRPIAAGVLVDDALLGASLPGAPGAALPPPPASSPLLAALSGHAARAVCWSNDLFSLEKELAAGDVHNLVVVLSRERGTTTQEAVSRAARMHDEEVRSFIGLEDRLLEERSRQSGLQPEWVDSYLDALKDRMRGNLDWTLAAARYGASAPDGGSR